MTAPAALSRILFRTGLFNWLRRPVYPYSLDPATLAFLVSQIDATRNLPGAIVEIGVWRGHTSVFLNEHLTNTGDPRSYIAVDTFSGFTDNDIEFEVAARGKPRQYSRTFKANDAEIYRRNLSAYPRVRVIEGDCAKLTPADLGPLSLALVDVDLYQPTRAALALIYSLLSPGGIVVVDDVVTSSPYGYDGATHAYLTFCNEMSLRPDFLGKKAGVIRKS